MACFGKQLHKRWDVLFSLLLLLIGVLLGRWTARSARETVTALIEFLPGSGTTVEGTQPLIWRFSSPMVAGPANIEPDEAPVRISPQVAGRFAWTTDRDLSFQPDSPWPAGRVYAIETTRRAVDRRGWPIMGPGALQVRTPALGLLRVEQADASSAGGTTLRLDFNAPPSRSALGRLLEVRVADIDTQLPVRVIGDAVSTTVLVHVPAPPGSTLNVALPAGLPPHEGTIASEASFRFRIASSASLSLTRLSPRTPAFDAPEIDAYFTAAIDPAAAAGFIRIEPETPYELRRLDRWDGSGLTFSGAFEPSHVYVLSFAAGLPSTHGGRLATNVVRHVQLADRPPSLAFPREGEYLSPGGPLAVPLTAVNVRECELSISRVLPENLVHFAMRRSNRYDAWYGRPREKLDRPLATWTAVVDAAANRPATLKLDLAPRLPSEASGAYVLRATAPKAEPDEKLLVVTDLGITAKRARDGVFAWVTSLRTARPVEGAHVVLRSEINEEMASGVTGPDGTVRLACRMDDTNAVPFLVSARQGADLSYIVFGDTPILQSGDASGRPHLRGPHEAYVFTDRGVYRPGETLRIKAVLRDAALACPAPFPVVARIRRPDGRIYRETTAMLSEIGTAEWSFEWPDYLPLGSYPVEIATPGAAAPLGETAVLLEEYVPPQIVAEIVTETARVAAGAEFSYQVRARHLFGRPAAGLEATGTVSVEPAPFEPPAWAGYRFGDAEREFSRDSVEAGAAVLDDNGAAGWTIRADPAWRPPAALKAGLSATVRELSGRAVTVFSSRTIDPYPFYIGLRPASVGGSLAVGQDHRVDVAAVRPDGLVDESVAGLETVLHEVRWTTLLRRQGGAYTYETVRTLHPCSTGRVTLAAGRGVAEFAARRSGDHVFTVRDPASGASSSWRFHAAEPGAGWVSWAMERPDFAELTLDRERYRPGETARLTIKAPFPGIALLTIETDRVLESRRIEMTANTLEVDLPVTAGWRPNVYCVATVIRPVQPAEIWTPHRASGVVSLAVDDPGRRLAVAIEAPPLIRPRSRLGVTVRVRDGGGAPAPAEVVVAAVDEGICRLTDFETPDPAAWFLSPRRHGVEQYDVYSDLLPLLSERAGAASHPPGGMASLSRRLNPVKASRFRPVALWSSTVRTDENGEAPIAFDVPEFTGELRLMAVAVNAQAFGSAARPATVRRPIVVQGSLPRFLAPGDTCRMPMAVFNESGADRTLAVIVAADGPISIDEPTHRFPLATGAATTLVAGVRAGPAPGVARCRISVEDGEEPFADEIEIAVRPPAPPVVATREGLVEAGRDAMIAPPDGWLAGSIRGEIWVTAQPEVRLGGALDALLRYPYGCLEQTVSASFPLLYLADLADRVRPGALGGMETAHFVRAGILRVLGMQTSAGGFAAWPHQDAIYDWGSIYATHFLIEASRAGHDVPADRLAAATGHLRDLLRRAPPPDADSKAGAWANDMARRAYACHVLALAAKPDDGWTLRLYETAGRLGAEARAHLAGALLLAGRPREAGTLLDDVGEPAAAGREDGGNLNSHVRNTALLLAVQAEIDPRAPRARLLAAKLDGWRAETEGFTTQENAAVLMALGKLYRAAPGPAEPFAAALLHDGSERPFTHEAPFRWEGPVEPGRPLSIRNRGPGPLPFFARLDGVPADGAVEEADRGLRVRRRILDRHGHPIHADRLPAGRAVMIEIDLDTLGARMDNLVIEDLLPAGLEIEHPALATSETLARADDQRNWVRHSDARDDRLLLFSGPVNGRYQHRYLVRAITPGRYVWPAITASAMYNPAIRSVHGRGVLEVAE